MLFPEELHKLSRAQLDEIAARVRVPLRRALEQLQIATGLTAELERLYLPLCSLIEQFCRWQDRALVVGINGGQGSGKSTLSTLLQVVLHHGFAKRTIGFSIDDLYLTRAERQHLAESVHPLFITRGVPGTHDVKLGIKLLDDLLSADTKHPVAIPVFDKSRDDRSPETGWRHVNGPFDVILFEGWCVAAHPQPAAALAAPVNRLEAEEDPTGTWRHYVNEQLKGPYADLFAKINRLIMLKVPDLKSIYRWRLRQEQKLAAASASGTENRIMDETALRRFIMHYERLTRSMLDEMPNRADICLELDSSQRITTVRVRGERFSKDA